MVFQAKYPPWRPVPKVAAVVEASLMCGSGRQAAILAAEAAPVGSGLAASAAGGRDVAVVDWQSRASPQGAFLVLVKRPRAARGGQ